jgi:hypothetical protein
MTPMLPIGEGFVSASVVATMLTAVKVKTIIGVNKGQQHPILSDRRSIARPRLSRRDNGFVQSLRT